MRIGDSPLPPVSGEMVNELLLGIIVKMPGFVARRKGVAVAVADRIQYGMLLPNGPVRGIL